MFLSSLDPLYAKSSSNGLRSRICSYEELFLCQLSSCDQRLHRSDHMDGTIHPRRSYPSGEIADSVHHLCALVHCNLHWPSILVSRGFWDLILI